MKYTYKDVLTKIAANTRHHVVESGDTVSQLAKRYKVSLDDFRRANPGLNVDRIRVGQRLALPELARRIAPPPPPIKYAIKSGDTFGHIGQRYGVSLNRLKKANPKVVQPLQIGDIVMIPESDRDNIKRIYGFDPDIIPERNNKLMWQQMYHESVLGKYDKPITNPNNSTAYGYMQMTRTAWDEALKNSPELFKNKTFEDLATDPQFALDAQMAYLAPHIRRWQYKNKRPATWDTAVRMWYNPADPHSAEADNYYNNVISVKLADIKARRAAANNDKLNKLPFDF